MFKGEPGITAEFLPKYHCELAEIEMFWRHAKYKFRKENDREWKTITRRVNRALDKFPVSYFAKLFRQVKAIEMAYDEGNTTAEELLHLKETNFLTLLKQLSAVRRHHRAGTSLQKEDAWNFLTLNKKSRKYISL